MTNMSEAAVNRGRRNSSPRRLRSAFTLAFAVLSGAACGTPHNPIRTSLIDLTGETREITVSSGSSLTGPIAVHRQATSIAGFLQMPDVGQQIQFTGGRDVTTAIGVAVLQSYRLAGEAGADIDPDLVRRVRDGLELVQELALEASRQTLEIGRLRDATGAGRADTARRIERLVSERGRTERRLDDARASLRSVANQPGILIARWRAEDSVAGTASLGDSLLGVGSAEQQDGFLILGGIRIVNIVLGEDFWWLINNLRPGEREFIEQIGIVTHLVQARYVAYTASRESEAFGALNLYGDVASVDPGDRMRIAAHWSSLAHYANGATLPQIKWTRETFCFACSLDLPELAEKGDRALPNRMTVKADYPKASYQGWRTVSATVTYLRDVDVLGLFSWHKWEDMAADYARAREMCSSPSCPRCGHQDCVVVPGRPRGGATATDGAR